MDGCYAGVGHDRGCGTRGKPFMVADDDCEGQEQVTNISGCCLVLTAGRKYTSDGADCNIFYVIFGGRWELRERTPAGIKRMKDIKQNEVTECHDRYGIRESLPMRARFWVKKTVYFRKSEHCR